MIALRQFKKLYNYYLLKILKRGYLPTINDVINLAGDELPQVSQELKPIYKYVPQTENAVFDIGMYNNAVDKINFDLEILFEELHDIEVKNLRRVTHADLFHAANSYELERVTKKLDSILFSMQGADEAFFCKFENFNTLSLLDKERSTPSIVSIPERSMSLPFLGTGTQRISMSNLAGITSIKVDLRAVSSGAKVVGNLPESNFGNIFKDDNGVWGVIVESDTNEKISIDFTFQLPREEYVNRCTLVHHGIKKQRAFLSYSVDNVNIRSMPEYAGGVVLSSQAEVVALDFFDALVEYFHVTLEKDEADDQIEAPGGGSGTKYQYIFALKNFGAWIGGREAEATYVSKVFDFSDDLSAIGKLALSTNQSTPEDTKIAWAMALSDSDGNQATPFMALTPQNIESSGMPTVLTTADTYSQVEHFTTTTANILNVFDFNSLPFYEILKINSEPIFGTALLERGRRVWARNKQGPIEAYTETDCFIDFATAGNTATLTSVKSDASSMFFDYTLGIGAGKNTCTLLNPIAPNQAHLTSFTATGGSGVGADISTTPNYAIYNAFLTGAAVSLPQEIYGVTTDALRASGLGGIGTFIAPFVGGRLNLGAQNILISSVSVTMRDSAGTTLNTYTQGFDYTIETDSIGNSTGFLVAVPGGRLDVESIIYEPITGTETWWIKWKYDLEITRFIESVNSNTVLFTDEFADPAVDEGGSGSGGTGAGPHDPFIGQTVIVKYKFVPKGIVKSSLVAKTEYGPLLLGESPYKQGTDYIFDTSTSGLQRLPSGSIAPEAAIYLDFIYEIETDLEEYTVWCKIENPDGVDITLKNPTTFFAGNQLITNDNIGEQLLVSIAGVGVIDITNIQIVPKLHGWVQFIVRSRGPFPENTDGTDDIGNKITYGSDGSASTIGSVVPFIDQVIALQDEDDANLFVEGGKYFSEIVATRQPLAQVTLPFLKSNTLKGENAHFAVTPVLVGQETKYQIIINFAPNTQTEIYSYIVDPANTTSSGTIDINSLLRIDEEWRVRWVDKKTTDASTGVLVKAELFRTNSTDGNITPKVFDYYVKVGY
jgi:hypothetical protein